MPNYPRIGELSKWSLIVLFEVFFLWEYIPVYVCHFKRCMDLEVGFYMVYLELLGFSFLWVMVWNGLCVCVVCVCVHAQLCPILCNPLPGSSVLGIFQARILEQVAISYSGTSFWPMSLAFPPLAREFFYHCHLGHPIEWLTQFIGHLKRLLDWWLTSELYV